MTIETATPSSVETIAALFDTLVEHVVARVLFKLDESIAAHVNHAMDTWASTAPIIDDRITDYVSHTLDIDSKMDEWAANFLQDRVSEHVTLDGSMLDIHDEVLEIVQEMSFDIRVSR
jgi:hypothetical protein